MTKRWVDSAIIYLFGAALVVGQMLRIQVTSGSSASILTLDAVLIILNLVLLGRLLETRRLGEVLREAVRHPVWRWAMAFLVWAAVTLLLNLGSYDGGQIATAAGYLLRLANVLVFAMLIAAGGSRFRFRMVEAIVLAGATVITIGLFQWLVARDFRFMAIYGWDPHVGRLVSTFFDPNYAGVFIVLIMALALGRAFEAKQRWPYWLIFGAGWLALFLAYSRSAWVVGTLAITALAWQRRIWLGLAFAALFVGILFLPGRLSDRFSESASLVDKSNYNKDGFVCSDGSTCDASGSNRVESIRQASDVIKGHWLYGVGYNAYGFALVKENPDLQRRLAKPSGQGSDASLLNIWATTGVIGLGLFLMFLGQAIWQLLRAAGAALPLHWTRRALAWFSLAWIAGSFFNNTLLYLPILAPWAVLVGVLTYWELQRRRT